MKVSLYKPPPALDDIVISISTIEASLPDGIEEAVSPYPPTPYQSLIFYCNDPISLGLLHEERFGKQGETMLIGPQYSRVNIKVHRRLGSVRVDFYPGGMYRLLGLPMYELFERSLDAVDFFGLEMKRVNEQLKNAGSLIDAKNMVENFLLSRISKMKEMLPFDRSMQVMLANNGNISVEYAASLACLSLKQFERKCGERLGMNPKLFARILRFSNAYRIHEANPRFTWTQIAHMAGYFDQMHMIRDFKVFAGMNPTSIEQQLQETPILMQKDLPR